MINPACKIQTLNVLHKGTLEIREKAQPEYKLPYTTVIGLDFLPIILLDLHDNARQLLYTLILSRELITNQAQYKVQGAKEKSRLTRAYKQLYEKGLVKRVKNTWYMLNPNAIIPYFDEHTNLVNKWNSL